MLESPKLEEHHGALVWVNPITEPCRKYQCLCLHCINHMNGDCTAAKKLYKICRDNNMALMITRCQKYSGIGGGL